MVAAHNYVLGCIFLSVYLFAGVIFSLVVQLIGTGQEGAWAKPYFESFLYHAVWVVVVPIALVVYLVERRLKKGVYPDVPWKTLFIWGIYAGPAIVISSFMYFLSLSRLPLSIASAISQCYFLFVFVLSVFVFPDEKVTLFRVLASGVCCGGLAMVAVSGLENTQQSLLLCCTWSGILFLLGSMVMSAVYQVLWCWLTDRIKEPFGKSLFLGFAGIASAGVFALLFGWIGLVVGHYTGTEPFQLPPPGPVLDGVLISCGMDFLLNAANLFTMLFVSPVFASVGSLLLIPLNILAQLIFAKTLPNALGWSGMALILVGCLGFEATDIIVAHFKRKQTQMLAILTGDEDEVDADVAGALLSGETTGLINNA